MVYRDKYGRPYLIVDVPECTSRFEYFKYFFCCAFPDVADTAVIRPEYAHETPNVMPSNPEQHANPQKPQPEHVEGGNQMEHCHNCQQHNYNRRPETARRSNRRTSNVEYEPRPVKNEHSTSKVKQEKRVRYGSKTVSTQKVLQRTSTRPLNEHDKFHKEYIQTKYGNQRVIVYPDSKGGVNEEYPDHRARSVRPPKERRDSRREDPVNLRTQYSRRPEYPYNLYRGYDDRQRY